MENQNILRIVLSLAILVAFFLPLNSTPIFGDNLTGWNVIADALQNIGHLNSISSAQIFTTVCLLLVFICVVVNLVLAIIKRKTSVFFNLLPLLAIIAMIAFSMTQSKENVAQTLQSFGTGFYIMFIGSFLLPFTTIAVTGANA